MQKTLEKQVNIMSSFCLHQVKVLVMAQHFRLIVGTFKYQATGTLQELTSEY